MGVRHYILTRSAYGPEFPPQDNERRLRLLEGITAPSLRAQTTRDLTWLALIDPADPLLERRRLAFESAGLPVILAPAEDLERSGILDRPQGPWAQHITWDDDVLTTRLDDDDAFAPWAMERVQTAAARSRDRTVWTLPAGYRVVGRYSYRIHWPLAQFVTLHVPAGDRATVYDVSHTAFADLGPMIPASEEPAWIWVRHRLMRSRVDVGSHTKRMGRTERPRQRLTPALRAAFPVDWRLIESLR